VCVNTVTGKLIIIREKILLEKQICASIRLLTSLCLRDKDRGRVRSHSLSLEKTTA